MGATLISVHAQRSGRLAHTHFLDHLAGDPGVIQHDAMVAAGDPVTAASDGFPTVIAELTVYDDDAPKAVATALGIVEALELPYA